MSGYTPVKIPTELIEEIDKRVGTLGYKSRAEFVKDAIRRRLDHFTFRIDPQIKMLDAEDKPIG